MCRVTFLFSCQRGSGQSPGFPLMFLVKGARIQGVAAQGDGATELVARKGSEQVCLVWCPSWLSSTHPALRHPPAPPSLTTQPSVPLQGASPRKVAQFTVTATLDLPLTHGSQVLPPWAEK